MPAKVGVLRGAGKFRIPPLSGTGTYLANIITISISSVKEFSISNNQFSIWLIVYCFARRIGGLLILPFLAIAIVYCYFCLLLLFIVYLALFTASPAVSAGYCLLLIAIPCYCNCYCLLFVIVIVIVIVIDIFFIALPVVVLYEVGSLCLSFSTRLATSNVVLPSVARRVGERSWDRVKILAFARMTSTDPRLRPPYRRTTDGQSRGETHIYKYAHILSALILTWNHLKFIMHHDSIIYILDLM